jgi:hypothetical protein
MSILSDHKFDEAYLEARKERKQRAEKEKQQKEPELANETELNFSQSEGVCYCCGKKGHKSPQCKRKNKPKSEWVINKTKEAAFISQAQSHVTNPDDQSVVASVNNAPTETQSSNLQQGEVKLFNWMAIALLFDQHQENQMKEWVLLDTGSTVNVFCNPDMVKNIVKAEKALTINTNAGEFTAEYTADLPWSDMKIWFDPNAITNVLSLGLQ